MTPLQRLGRALVIPLVFSLVLAAGLGGAGREAAATVTFDAPRRIAACAPLRDAPALDPLARADLVGRRCRIPPGLRFYFLSSDPVSWPVIQEGQGPLVSLEDPVARRQWLPGTTPLATNVRSGRLVIARDAEGRPRAAYYSAFADRTEGGGSIALFVVVRLRPEPCLLGIVQAEAEARRLAAGEGKCLPPVGDG